MLEKAPLGGETVTMASIEDFVQSPCKDLLNSHKRDQLLKVGDYYSVEVSKKLNKNELVVT